MVDSLPPQLPIHYCNDFREKCLEKNINYILCPARIEAGTSRVFLSLCHPQHKSFSPPGQCTTHTGSKVLPGAAKMAAGLGTGFTSQALFPCVLCIRVLNKYFHCWGTVPVSAVPREEAPRPSWMGVCACGGSVGTQVWGYGVVGQCWGGPSHTHRPGGFPSWLLGGGDLSPLISDAISGLAEQS